MLWLPEPGSGDVAGGFDGSTTDDWTAIRLETREGFQFTPRYGPDSRPTIWDPAQWGGQIPRGEVHAAWDELSRRYRLRRVYCDPRDWQSEIETWALTYGEEVFVPWPTYQIGRMFPALNRFTSDLATGELKHDGCPITAIHVANARKVAKPGDKYILGKPSQHQKIDAAVTSVICHEAAADERAAGWQEQVDSRMFVFR